MSRNNTTLYSIEIAPSMLALSGCVVTGPVVQQWDSLVRNETNKRVAGGVRGETSASSSSSSCAATPPGLQRLASSQSAYSDTNDSASTLFGVDGDDDELDGFGDQNIFSSSQPLAPISPTLQIPIEWSAPAAAQPAQVNVPDPSPTDGNQGAVGQLIHPWIQQFDRPVLSKKMFGDIKRLAVASVEDQKEFVAKLDLQGLATHCFQQMVVIQNQEESMTEARKKLKRKAQQVRRLERQVVSKKNEIQDMLHGSAQSLEIVRTGRRLTWRTSVILGLRKLMCIISANAFPLASLVDVSRWTVTRCEIMAWAVLLGRTRAWYKTLMTLLKEVCQHMVNNAGAPSSFALVSASEVTDLSNKRRRSSTVGVADLPTQDDAIRADFGLPSASSWVSQLTVSLSQTELNWDGVVASTSWAGDATNSSIWQRQKVQGIEIQTIVLTNKRALVEEQYDLAFKSMACMSLSLTLWRYFFICSP